MIFQVRIKNFPEITRGHCFSACLIKSVTLAVFSEISFGELFTFGMKRFADKTYTIFLFLNYFKIIRTSFQQVCINTKTVLKINVVQQNSLYCFFNRRNSFGKSRQRCNYADISFLGIQSPFRNNIINRLFFDFRTNVKSAEIKNSVSVKYIYRKSYLRNILRLSLISDKHFFINSDSFSNSKKFYVNTTKNTRFLQLILRPKQKRQFYLCRFICICFKN